MERFVQPANAHAALVLTHGAGSNADAPLLVALSAALADQGWAVLRINLAFRQQRTTGPPHPSGAAADRASLATAIASLSAATGLPLFAGGHSYGGRQATMLATMLAAEQPALLRGLLILSYPLHPPAQPAKLRTGHLPLLITPTLFVSGTRDDFGTPSELAQALSPHELVLLEGMGHSLPPTAATRIAEAWVQFSGKLV